MNPIIISLKTVFRDENKSGLLLEFPEHEVKVVGKVQLNGGSYNLFCNLLFVGFF